VLGDVQRLRQAHEHALVALEVIGRRERAGDVDRLDAAGATGVDRGGADLGLALELGGGAGDPHDIAQADVVVVAVEDEDAVGGGRVAVAGRVLEVEAAQGGRGALVVADHDALGGDGFITICKIRIRIDDKLSWATGDRATNAETMIWRAAQSLDR
jgi:hypothetical protein